MISKAQLNSIVWFILIASGVIDYYWVEDFNVFGTTFAVLIIIVFIVWISNKVLFTFTGKRILY